MFKKLANAIDKTNLVIGNSISWLCILLIVLTVGIVVARTLFNVNSLAAQDSVIYAHAALFMLSIALGVSQNTHVRVDVFYRNFSPLTQAWVNATGALLFLLPFAIFITALSWEFAKRSWSIGETSSDTGGLPFVFILKTVIPLSGLLLILQALSQFIKNTVDIMYISSDESPLGNQECTHD